MTEPPAPGSDKAEPVSDADRARGRRQVWTIYVVAVVITAVLAATVTLPGPQRWVALGTVVVGVAGMAIAMPLLRRAPRAPTRSDDRSKWLPTLAVVPVLVVGDLIRSVGPARGGFMAQTATGFAALFLVLPALLAIDAGLRIRRARKLAGEPPVSGPPSPRP